MLTAARCLSKYGDPKTNEAKFMRLITVPTDTRGGAIPAKIYCNVDMAVPILRAIRNIVQRGLANQVLSWDGCFCIRNTRNGQSPSLHSWGVAVDINQGTNKLGHTPSMSPELVKCFTDEGFDWGGAWSTPDGMHFQLTYI